MPEKYDDSLFVCIVKVPFNGFVDCAVVDWLPVEPGVVGRIVLHIEASDHRMFSCA